MKQKDKVMLYDCLVASDKKQSVLRLVPNTKENRASAKQLVARIFGCNQRHVQIRYRKGKRSEISFTKDVLKTGAKAFDVYVKGTFKSPDEIDYQLKQISDLHTRLRDLRAKNVELEDEVGPLQSHVDRLKGELQEEYSRNSKLQADLDKANQDRFDLKRDSVLWHQNKDLLKMLLDHKQADLEYMS